MRVLLLVAAFLEGTLGLVACSDGDECIGAPSESTPVISSVWSGAAGEARERFTTKRLFEAAFPHGAVSDMLEGSLVDIPNARLSISREQRLVVRSYLDERGREVIEEYRIPEAGIRPYKDSCIAGEAIPLTLTRVLIEGETLNVANEYTGFQITLRNEYAPGDIEGDTLWVSFTAVRTIRGRGFHQQYTWREEYQRRAE